MPITPIQVGVAAMVACAMASTVYYAALWLHEGTHWVAGRLGGSEPDLMISRWARPYRVRHHAINRPSAIYIRLSGGLPLMWGVIGPLAVWLAGLQVFPLGLLLTSTTVGSLIMATESDWIALTDPEEFRAREQKDDFSERWLFLVPFKRL